MKKIVLMCGALVFLLAGCGQKGPLYLPQPAKPSPDAPQTAPEPVKPKPESNKESTGY
ncbi:LPS translocon maturation chaperone LptM [Cellvibrio zantedeschiae]|uniref:LPS translocon maturation chaperone LptM n=1 Tax=Cellvibrio zantedeschiae TaxID=1237077 RepID=UPI0016796C04|nr:lipoprotein [Cellvibrio zantedeschiae]